MDCCAVRGALLVPDEEAQATVEDHLAFCAACSRFADGAHTLDIVLSQHVLIQPPVELQLRLAALARASAQPAPGAHGLFSLPWLTWPWLTGPNGALAQLVAAVMVGWAAWRAAGLAASIPDAIGNVPYAVQLVLASPALRYLGDWQLDGTSLLVWSAVGLVAWLFSENSPLRHVFGPSAELP